jgi:hypothetical protein
VRIWQRPHVKIGGRYPMEDGHIVVDDVTSIEMADITHDLARESGFDSVDDLLAIARHGPGDQIYLVRFHYLPPGGWEKEVPRTMKKTASKPSDAASRLIDARVKQVGGWRGETLARLRAVITQADPKIVEEWKWDVPVWSCGGIICTGEVYKRAVKLTFAHGASLKDPAGLFNSSLEGKVRRAIDFHEGDEIDAKALKALIKAAVKLNAADRD